MQPPKVAPGLVQNGHVTPSLDQLSTSICTNATKLSWYLESSGLPTPSFDKDGPTKILPSEAPEAVHQLRQKLKQDALKLFRLASGPEEYLSHLAVNHQYTICLRWLCHFKIFSLVPLRGSISYNNIAVLTSCSESQLKSIARMAITSGLFTEPEPGRLAHSGTSYMIATNPDYESWANCITTYMFDCSSKFADAGGKWPRSPAPEHSAFNLANNTPVPFAGSLPQDPTMMKEFFGFLRATNQIEANDLRHLVSGFDWKSLGKATVVDVSSASAYPSISLAKAFPLLDVVAQPLPRNAADVASQVKPLPSELTSRISVEALEMPLPQPRKGADVYVLRHALHNIPPETATAIVKNIAADLKPGARLIINDIALPLPGDNVDPYQEAMVRARDLVHKELSNGNTKDMADWVKFLAKADPKLKIVSAVTPSGSDLSLLEVRVESAQNGVPL